MGKSEDQRLGRGRIRGGDRGRIRGQSEGGLEGRARED